jgi:hypothetical protein
MYYLVLSVRYGPSDRPGNAAWPRLLGNVCCTVHALATSMATDLGMDAGRDTTLAGVALVWWVTIPYSHRVFAASHGRRVYSRNVSDSDTYPAA